jgi:hypothetical protein
MSIPHGADRRAGVSISDRQEAIVQYMLLLYGEPLPPDAFTPELWQRVVAAHGDFTKRLTDAGGLVASAPLEPVESARTVRFRRRERLVTGPVDSAEPRSS